MSNAITVIPLLTNACVASPKHGREYAISIKPNSKILEIATMCNYTEFEDILSMLLFGCPSLYDVTIPYMYYVIHNYIYTINV